GGGGSGEADCARTVVRASSRRFAASPPANDPPSTVKVQRRCRFMESGGQGDGATERPHSTNAPPAGLSGFRQTGGQNRARRPSQSEQGPRASRPAGLAYPLRPSLAQVDLQVGQIDLAVL